MKKTIAILLTLALALSLLCACDLINPQESTTASSDGASTKPIGREDPDRHKAAMEPLQGGDMLYTFSGATPYGTMISEMDDEEYPVYPIGLIDQNGELVSPPVYEEVKYIYAEDKAKVIGLIARKEQAFTLYTLDGESRELPCEGYDIVVYPGGKYATVETADYMNTNGDTRDGLFDLTNDRYVIEPKDGQLIQYYAGGLVFGYQYKTLSLDNDDLTAQWAFSCADKSVLDLPLELGRVQEYYPEAGWFGAMLLPQFQQRYYDKDLQPLNNLTGWNIYPDGFNGGDYCMLYNNDDFPDLETWANRGGEIVDMQIKEDYIRNVAHCYVAGASFGQWSVLYDANLKPIREAGADERFVVLWGWPLDSFVLIGSDGKITAAFDGNGKPFAKSGALQSWDDWDTGTVYAVKDGNWRTLDLKAFAPAEPDENGWEGYAAAAAICEDYVVLQAGWSTTYAAEVKDTFAIDWQGKPYPNCPLEPYYEQLSRGRDAGEQGSNYFWLELESKRGYVNTRGEWVFVDETEM